MEETQEEPTLTLARTRRELEVCKLERDDAMAEADAFDLEIGTLRDKLSRLEALG